MSTARASKLLALLGAAIVGAVVAIALHGEASAPAVTRAPSLTTATVTRTDLSTTALAGGTLGYAPAAPVTNQLSGTYTWLPALGMRIARGGTLFRVDNSPAVLMIGTTPAWRTFALGMTSGPDVRELQANLIALGHAHGLLSEPTGCYDWATADAVERWQLAEHKPVTGEIALGQVLFAPSSVRVGALDLVAGQAASPGQAPFRATATSRTVAVPITPNQPAAWLGERVSILLPSGASASGRVTAIGPPPPGTDTGSGAQGAPRLTVTPGRGAATGSGDEVAVQVSLTTQSVRNVLAAPVAALLALAGGGHGVDVIEPSGAHRLIGVRTGVFAGGQVQLSGAGIQAGTKIVVAQ
jgi:peptidoglycan hydrolase-like protein with peptidoglycan-binding domain